MLREQLSKAEYKLLCLAVTDAVRLQAGGDTAAGYRCLTMHVDRVREFAEAGEPWAKDLVHSYLTALDEYASLRSGYSFAVYG